MPDFPREVGGHVLDREERIGADGVSYDYWCLDCGLELEELDVASLRATPCAGTPAAPGSDGG